MAYVWDVLVGMSTVYLDPFYNTGQYSWHFLGTQAVNYRVHMNTSPEVSGLNKQCSRSSLHGHFAYRMERRLQFGSLPCHKSH